MHLSVDGRLQDCDLYVNNTMIEGLYASRLSQCVVCLNDVYLFIENVKASICTHIQIT